MNRNLTNRIRYVLDELIPPAIRDSRWFMWPFFVAAYGKFSVTRYMDFKSFAYSMSEIEYATFYRSLGSSISRKRETDLNNSSLKILLEEIKAANGSSFLDVGAGNGFLLSQVSKSRTWRRIVGVDVAPTAELAGKFDCMEGTLPHLPFIDDEFDVVTCTHVVEHLIDPIASAKDLIRITGTLLLIVVPKQRYYYYTLDEHLNFYPNVEPLMRLFEKCKIRSLELDGDWLLIIHPNKSVGSLSE